ncbi:MULTISPECIES: DnaJ domain-containing protein [Haloarcula]|uniref:DnaJ domain-containing protein n=1 Tax=Haloarcula TaxID=2237 RepID=UPI0023ECD982|nr:DnaJ domain-containing protein [Halomicroarcula sp. XH51]
MTETYYDRLGVSQGADRSAIKQAWQRAVKEKHPDHNDDSDAQQQFIQIKEAYDVLSDPEERARYDELGHEQYLADRQHGGTDTGDAYRRDRTARDATGRGAGQQRQSGAGAESVDWGAYTRGHETAEHVWKAGSGPTADTAPPTDTAHAGFVERTVAYGALVLVPGFFSTLLLPVWANDGPSNPATTLLGLDPGVLSAAVPFTAGTLLVTLLLVAGAETLLDTDRRIWRPF